jgi:hypothetical protein
MVSDRAPDRPFSLLRRPNQEALRSSGGNMTRQQRIALVLVLTCAAAAAAQGDLPPIFTGVTTDVGVPAGAAAWAVRIVTRGGLTGRGRGDVLITSDRRVTCDGGAPPCATTLSEASAAALGRLIAQVDPAAGSRSSLGVCRDCYATLLVLRMRSPDGATRTLTAYWDVTTQAQMPPELLRLYEALIAARDGRG